MTNCPGSDEERLDRIERKLDLLLKLLSPDHTRTSLEQRAEQKVLKLSQKRSKKGYEREI